MIIYAKLAKCLKKTIDDIEGKSWRPSRNGPSDVFYT